MSSPELSASHSDVELDSEKTLLLQENHKPEIASPRNNVIYSQLPKLGSPSQRIKKKDESLTAIFCQWIVEHQTGLTANLLLLLFLVHVCFPKARRHTRKFFELSYYNPETNNYTAGWNDAFMVSFWIVIFTGLRAIVMGYVLKPFAAAHGIRRKKDITRFAEQGWLLSYATVFWLLGMYIMYTSDYWLNLKNMWVDWPIREIPGLRKWYILAQYSFWLQQIVVVNLEERRKDHWQMFSHHIVTSLLIFAAYGYHQTKVANVILCLMDIADIFLPLGKCLKYLGCSTVCDIVFGVFMAVWLVSRHVLYGLVCYSVWKDIPVTINLGCYKGKQGALTGPFPAPDRLLHLIEPFQDPEGVVCFNQDIKWYFLGCLLFLQALIMLWFGLILQVAMKVLRGGAADDNRSDDEDDGEDEDEEVEEGPISFTGPKTGSMASLVPLEEEVGVEAINFKSRSRSRKYRTGVSTTSGVTIPGHSDRKELLGRIGCDKGV